MAIADDVSIAANGDIRYEGDAHGGAAPGYYTVLELHRYLMDYADNATETGDDLMSIVRAEPADRSTDNIITMNAPYNIDDTLAEHLYDGSITQEDGDVVYSGLVLVGAVESGTEPIIVQNNAVVTNYWGTGLNADAANNIIMRMLVKTRSSGADIDGKRIRLLAREWGDSFAEFSVTMGLGNSTAALFTSADLNNTTLSTTVAGWSSITNVEGYQTIDLSNGDGAQPYYSQWNKGDQTIAQLYERTKYIQRRGSSSTIHGINGQLFRGPTHQWDYDNEASGPFQEDEVVGWGTGATAGTGLLLALLDSGTTGTMWIQLLTGVAPVNNAEVTGVTSAATCDVDGAPTTRTVSPEFIGQYTGSSIIGAFGIGIEAADLAATDKLFDLTNTQRTPPNQQTYTVSGLVSGEDYVAVYPNDGSDGVDYDQLSLDGEHTSANDTVTVVEDIPADTPASGKIRMYRDSTTSYDLIAYTSWTGKVFTLTENLAATYATGANVFIAYIDVLASGTTASFTAIYSTDRSLLVRVRDGGASPIKCFTSPGTFTSTGGSIAAIRQSDV